MTCMWCKEPIEGLEGSHGICPECKEREMEKIEADYGPAIRREIERARTERRVAA